MMSSTITFGTLSFPFSTNPREGLVEEEPGLLRFYPLGSYVEVNCEDEEGDGPFRDSLTSSSDSHEDPYALVDAPASDVQLAQASAQLDYFASFDTQQGEASCPELNTERTRYCRLCRVDSHSSRRCPARCRNRSCARRRMHADGTCYYRKRICRLCGESGHGQARCPTAAVPQV